MVAQAHADNTLYELQQNIPETHDLGLNFVTLEKGVYSGISKPLFIVIRSEEEWDKIWDQHVIAVPPRPKPHVDLSKEMIIGVFSGSKSSGGYGIEVKKIEQRENSLTVFYEESSPSPGEVVTAVMTQPYHLIKAEKQNIKIDFKQSETEEGK